MVQIKIKKVKCLLNSSNLNTVIIVINVLFYVCVKGLLYSRWLMPLTLFKLFMSVGIMVLFSQLYLHKW